MPRYWFLMLAGGFHFRIPILGILSVMIPITRFDPEAGEARSMSEMAIFQQSVVK
jgi:hypothetical protein